MERRTALQTVLAAYLSRFNVSEAAETATGSTEPYADSQAADLWMRSWMRQPAAANGMLSVKRFADHYYWLTEGIQWHPDDPHSSLHPVSVPPGFVTDFASIPRIAWSILPPDGDYVYPAVVHDFLYWSQSTTRQEADDVFRAMMKEFKIASASVLTIYLGVRAGGGIAWSENNHLKQAGERRVLKRMPNDPKTRWEVWKHGDVFGVS